MFCALSPTCNTEDESSPFLLDVCIHLLEDHSTRIGKLQYTAEQPAQNFHIILFCFIFYFELDVLNVRSSSSVLWKETSTIFNR